MEGDGVPAGRLTSGPFGKDGVGPDRRAAVEEAREPHGVGAERLREFVRQWLIGRVWMKVGFRASEGRTSMVCRSAETKCPLGFASLNPTDAFIQGCGPARCRCRLG